MTFFTKVTAPSKATFETVEKEYVAWNKGLHGVNGAAPRTAETLARMSIAQKGRTVSAEHRAKLSAVNVGKTLSAEHRAKIGAAHKGRTLPAEHRAKIGAAHKGRKMSEEHRAHLIAIKARPVMTPHGLFPSVRAVVEASGYPKRYVYAWMKRFPEHYYYVNKGE